MLPFCNNCSLFLWLTSFVYKQLMSNIFHYGKCPFSSEISNWRSIELIDLARTNTTDEFHIKLNFLRFKIYHIEKNISHRIHTLTWRQRSIRRNLLSVYQFLSIYYLSEDESCRNKATWCEAAEPNCENDFTKDQCQKYCHLCDTGKYDDM